MAVSCYGKDSYIPSNIEGLKVRASDAYILLSIYLLVEGQFGRVEKYLHSVTFSACFWGFGGRNTEMIASMRPTRNIGAEMKMSMM